MSSIKLPEDFTTCCRTCLSSESSNLCDIFDVKVNCSAAEMLSICTNIKVNKNDRLPKKLCESCYQCLINFYDFKRIAENINQTLLDQFNYQQSLDCQEIPGLIKNEFDEIDYFNDFDVDLTNKSEDLNVSDSLQTLELSSNVANNSLPEQISGKKKRKLNGMNKDSLLTFDPCSDITNNSFEQNSNKKRRKREEISLNADDNTQTVELSSNANNSGDLKQSTGTESIKLKKDTLKYEDDSKSFRCVICSETFRKRLTYIKHLAKHSKVMCSEINQNTTESNVTCDVCSATFRSQNALSAHKRKHVAKSRILECKYCFKLFKKVSHLKRHELCHEDNKLPYKCISCPKSYMSETALQEHENVHKGYKPYPCPICQKRFFHMHSMSKHLQTHTGDCPFLCPTCGKKFGAMTNLRQHMRRHLGLKIFDCKLCPLKFVTKGECEAHQVTHTGFQAFTCKQCGSRFKKRSSLTKHEFQHLGLRPFQCDSCSKKFKTKEHLKCHQRIHTGEKPYQCDECARAFKRSGDLLKHRRTHFGGQLYKCDECEDGFRLKSELRDHIAQNYISSYQPLKCAYTAKKSTGEDCTANESSTGCLELLAS